jgi:RHS repeat-associated protein
MVYSEVSDHVEKNRTISEYRYDGLGRRTLVRDAGGDAMRTLYDGTGFEAVREGVVFSDGRFTTRYSSGIQTATNTGTGGSRYRWVGGESEAGRTRVIYEDGYRAATSRYTGISVTLYGRGEAVAVSHSGANSRGGTAYLGKDILGSVRSTTDDGGSLEDRYEYDAFGKPYKGDLTAGMNLGYTGKPYDTTTGLYNYGYRDYKPEAARFTTVDPIRDGANWFAYVNNDPVNWVDPWGLYLINDITLGKTVAYDYQSNKTIPFGANIPSIHTGGSQMIDRYSNANIQLPAGLNDSLKTSHDYQTDNNPNTESNISASANETKNGNYEVSITVQNSRKDDNGTVISSRPESGVVAYADKSEVTTDGKVDPGKVTNMANNAINLVNHTPPQTDNHVTYNYGR